MFNFLKRILPILLCGSSLKAQYAGSLACQSCHPDKFDLQSKSAHARALAPAPKGSPGQWAFGAGEKAITYVSQLDEDTYVEHGLTYYSASKTMALTPGHKIPNDQHYPTFDPVASALRCFRCHSTGKLRLNAGFRIEPSESGVRCEACHGPGGLHVKAGGGAGTILNPKQLNAVQLNEFCGVCHRKAPEAGEEKDWTNPWNSRHQPTYLSQSACFLSSTAMSCLTCHDPHRPLSRATAEYDRRCTGCHHTVRHQAPTASRACVDCHMPKVLALRQLHFTNHWIGIYLKGNPMVPVRRTGRSQPPVTLKPSSRGRFAPPNDPSTLRPLFEQGLEERERQFGPGHPRVARMASNLGLFLRETGDPAAAEAPLRKALEIDRANRDPNLFATQEDLAQVLEVTGKRQEALDLFRQAAAGSDLAVAARSFASLAMLDSGRASSYYSSSLQAEEAASGPNHPRVAILLNNLALALMEANDLKAAEPLLRRALAIQEKALGPDHYETAATLSNFGSLLQSLGKLAEAERAEREAVRTLEQKRPQTRELATAYTNLADLLANRRERTAAAALLRRAIVIDEAVYGAEDPEVAADLTNLGVLLLESGDRASADALLKRALAIYEKTLGPGSPQAIDVRQNLQRSRR